MLKFAGERENGLPVAHYAPRARCAACIFPSPYTFIHNSALFHRGRRHTVYFAGVFLRAPCIC